MERQGAMLQSSCSSFSSHPYPAPTLAVSVLEGTSSLSMEGTRAF